MQTLIRDYEPEPGARVRIISDLHYGHHKCQAPAPAKLVAMMQGVDVLIIAGDCAENRETKYCTNGFALREALQAECNKAGITLLQVAGNHDPEQGCQMLRLWQGQCVIIHGHQLFEEVAPWGWEYIQNKQASNDFIAQFPQRHQNLTQRLQLAQQLSSYRCGLGNNGAHKTGIKLLDHMLHCFWPPERPYNIVKAWLSASHRAQAFAQQFAPDSRILVFGHVHRHGAWKRGKRQLFTTGAWFQHAKAFCLDLQDGQVIDYHQIKK